MDYPTIPVVRFCCHCLVGVMNHRHHMAIICVLFTCECVSLSGWLPYNSIKTQNSRTSRDAIRTCFKLENATPSGETFRSNLTIGNLGTASMISCYCGSLLTGTISGSTTMQLKTNYAMHTNDTHSHTHSQTDVFVRGGQRRRRHNWTRRHCFHFVRLLLSDDFAFVLLRRNAISGCVRLNTTTQTNAKHLSPLTDEFAQVKMQRFSLEFYVLNLHWCVGRVCVCCVSARWVVMFVCVKSSAIWVQCYRECVRIFWCWRAAASRDIWNNKFVILSWENIAEYFLLIHNRDVFNPQDMFSIRKMDNWQKTEKNTLNTERSSSNHHHHHLMTPRKSVLSSHMCSLFRRP